MQEANTMKRPAGCKVTRLNITALIEISELKLNTAEFSQVTGLKLNTAGLIQVAQLKHCWINPDCSAQILAD